LFIRIGDVEVRHLLSIQKVGGSSPAACRFFLLRLARKSGIIPGWEREHPRKSPVWEQVHLPVLEYSGLGK
jgi:hypothetical protein